MSETPDRYNRHHILEVIGKSGQKKLSQARVLIVGCGALGTHSAEYLARGGIGELRLVDRDFVDWSNLQRQIAFTEEDVRNGTPKAIALKKHLEKANSSIQIKAEPTEFQFFNALKLAENVDLVIDASDNIPTRFLINDLSWKTGTPWIYGGAIETRGHALFFSGTQGPCLRCYMGEPPPPGTLQTCDTAGVLGPAVAMVSSIQASMAMRTLIGDRPELLGGRLFRLDSWNMEWKESRLEADPDCPVCVHRHFDFLQGKGQHGTEALCGREAVQVHPKSGESIDLQALAGRLESVGNVECHSRYLRLTTDDFTMTLFDDQRAIFDGLTDASKARNLYSRYVGD
jgi:adenylyltransferase/sulfurtransferase